MAQLTIASYLKYADVQMAAEALFGFKAPALGANLVPGETTSGTINPQVLMDGNLHSSRFTAAASGAVLVAMGGGATHLQYVDGI
jgi:hypothetical protein